MILVCSCSYHVIRNKVMHGIARIEVYVSFQDICSDWRPGKLKKPFGDNYDMFCSIKMAFSC